MATFSVSATLTARVEELENGTFQLDEGEPGVKTKFSHNDVIAVIPLPPRNGVDLEYRLLAIRVDQPSDQGQRHFSLIDRRIRSPPEALVANHLVKRIPAHLEMCKAHPTLVELSVIISTKSGLCEAEGFFDGVVQPLLSTLGFSKDSYVVHHTTSEQSIKAYATGRLCVKANAGVSQVIILLSGDGGVIDLINSLFSCSRSPSFVKPVMGLLVLGTGNALANSSGLNEDSTKGLASFLRGEPRSVPTFASRFSPGSVMLVDQARKTEPLAADENGVGVVHGAVVTSWCLHASLVADSDTTEYRKHGRDRFSMAANELLDPTDGSPSHVYRGKITSIHKDRTGAKQAKVWDRTEHMYVLVTLVSNLEAGLTISPRSRPLDGRLRVVHFGPLPSAEIKGIFGQAFSGGKHVNEPSVGYNHVDGLKIEFNEPDERWRRVCVDGRIIRVEEGGWVEVQREDRDIVDLVVDSN